MAYAQYGKVFAGAVILAVSLIGCASWSATLKLPDVGRERWRDLKVIGDDVAARFGFVSDAKELLGHEIKTNGRWVVVGAYSNRNRGLRGLDGGYSHVEYFIFAQSGTNDAEVTIRDYDYDNAEQSEYERALEIALTDGFRAAGMYSNTGWQSRVVHTFEP